MDEGAKLAFESAQDAVKQLIGLSTAIIALTITFAKDYLGRTDGPARGAAYAAWGAFFLSVLFGLWALLAITGTLASQTGPDKAHLRNWNITLPARLQVAAFVLAMALTVVFGGCASSSPNPVAPGASAAHAPSAKARRPPSPAPPHHPAMHS